MPDDLLTESSRIAELISLPVGWCRRGLEHIYTDDISGAVGGETQRQQKNLRRRNERGDESIQWGPYSEAEVRRRSSYLFASKKIRRYLLESISVECWVAILRHASKKKPTDLKPPDTEDYRIWRESRDGLADKSDAQVRLLWIQRQIGLRLGTDETNIGRWERGETVPGGDKVLGAVLIALQAEITSIEFPDRKDILSAAAARTLSHIGTWVYEQKQRNAASLAGAPPQGMPSLHEIAIVREALRDKYSEDLSEETPSADAMSRIEILLERVSNIIVKKYPEIKIKSSRDVHSIAKKWCTSYVIFRIGLVCGWPHPQTWNWNNVDANGR